MGVDHLPSSQIMHQTKNHPTNWIQTVSFNIKQSKRHDTKFSSWRLSCPLSTPYLEIIYIQNEWKRGNWRRFWISIAPDSIYTILHLLHIMHITVNHHQKLKFQALIITPIIFQKPWPKDLITITWAPK
jgi:hypothetical protein